MPARVKNPDPEADREWHDELRRLIAYDPLTGLFTWRVNYTPRARAGMVAGRAHTARYWEITVRRRRVLGHRLAWFMVHGVWPEGQLDHWDLDGLNNRIANLRPSSQSENVANTGKRCTNTSGYKGVGLLPNGRYRACIVKDGRQIWLGSHKTAEQAHAAYVQAAANIYGKFARVA